ncbi:MAG: phosphotyrosine protein phosphatase [Amylibacter sp.]|nr:phosphotyrosine protein phosphatase [Amylibacter sp.]
MNKPNILFICGKARKRSPTAADLVAQWDVVNIRYAGVGVDADTLVSLDEIEWADKIIVMELKQKKKLNATFGNALRDKPIRCLGIPDNYEYMQPELVEILTTKLAFLRN